LDLRVLRQARKLIYLVVDVKGAEQLRASNWGKSNCRPFCGASVAGD
jgi:hypothetical protein